MSFSFTASGNREAALATVGQQPSAPPEFVALIQSQLSLLPEDATVSLSAYGHTGWGKDQIAGEISLHCSINVTTPRAHQPEPA